nr:uncharacterized protein LOC109164785 [Ipomoea batatas]
MSSNNSSSSEFMAEVRCRCRYLAPMKMSWSYANPGKRYRGLGSCRYFEWMDYDVSERVSNVLRWLLKKAYKYEKEIEKLSLGSGTWESGSGTPLEVVSWLSIKVTAFLGAIPISPDGFPAESFNLPSSPKQQQPEESFGGENQGGSNATRALNPLG